MCNCSTSGRAQNKAAGFLEGREVINYQHSQLYMGRYLGIFLFRDGEEEGVVVSEHK